MQCMTCQAPIHPEFVHSIKSNICPACGGQMMNDAAQELIKELSEALTKMPNDPQGIAGWLLSHYELRKVGTGEPVNEFYGTQKAAAQQPGHPGVLRVPENRIQKFLKQAGVKRPIKRPEEYADLVNEIQGVDYGDIDGPITVSESDDVLPESQDPEYTKAVLRAAMNTPSPRRGRSVAVTPGAAGASEDIDQDLSNLHPALHEDRMNRLKQQMTVSSGGKAGVISRKD